MGDKEINGAKEDDKKREVYWRKKKKRSLIYVLKDRTAWERIEGLEVPIVDF